MLFMNVIMTETINYFLTLPLWELLAVFASLAYVILAAQGNLWCWPAAILSTVIYTVIFYDVYLWSDSVLQMYYFVMAVYGWITWQQHKQTNTLEKGELPIVKLFALYHVKAIGLLTILSLIVGYLMATYTPTDFAYLDAATTVFAIYATYLVTQRVLENWLYWVVIDAISIYLYSEKGLTPTAVLFALYTVFAIYGYLRWHQKLTQQDVKKGVFSQVASN
jgi:nicotinamide mononucleotide transporter